jgi:hypothetical protein
VEVSKKLPTWYFVGNRNDMQEEVIAVSTGSFSWGVLSQALDVMENWKADCPIEGALELQGT